MIFKRFTVSIISFGREAQQLSKLQEQKRPTFSSEALRKKYDRHLVNLLRVKKMWSTLCQCPALCAG
jgi:hypothetical protein